MLDKGFVERFLRLNNISTDAPDEEIKAALAGAKWTDIEIATAIGLLRDPKAGSGVVAVSKGHSGIFRPDFDWSSKELSALLGVDVVIDPRAVNGGSKKLERKIKFAHALRSIALVIIAFAFALALGLMVAYTLEAGPFYEASATPPII